MFNVHLMVEVEGGGHALMLLVLQEVHARIRVKKCTVEDEESESVRRSQQFSQDFTRRSELFIYLQPRWCGSGHALML